MPNTTVVFGAQWGDEGKGKVVDFYAADADVIVRYAGGNNAGHTLVVGGRKIILHLVPSAIMHPEKKLILGNQMVIDPAALHQEICEIQEAFNQASDEWIAELFNINVEDKTACEIVRGKLSQNISDLKVSGQAHILMPYHRELDRAREADSKSPIGTTGRGIGPAYEYKMARRGIRMSHLRHPELFDALVKKALVSANMELAYLTERSLGYQQMIEFLEKARENFLPRITNINTLVHAYYRLGKKILFEGAQGAGLDIDHGTYPYVTSSNTLAAGACFGGGVGPNAIGEIIGVSKAYTTRVGRGPFPTKITGELEEAVRKAGGEYGATTGRPRDCGWLDLPQLRYAARINGMTGIFFTKLDVLRGIGPIRVCHLYKLSNEYYSQMDDVDTEMLGRVEPVYTNYPGFEEDISGARSLAELPKNAHRFIQAVSAEIGVPISGVSVGPDRKQTIRIT